MTDLFNNFSKRQMNPIMQIELVKSVYFSFSVESEIFKVVTPFQTLQMFQNHFFGKVFCIDGVIQFSEKDYHCYHDAMLSKVISKQRKIERILIVGGGDLLLAEKILQIDVGEIIIVDIDKAVTDLISQYANDLIPTALGSPKITMVHEDGFNYLFRSSKVFDAIFIDCTDPSYEGVSEKLYSYEFYNLCARNLKKPGVLVTQNGIPFYDDRCLKRGYMNLTKTFTEVEKYFAVVPSLGGEIAFCLATK